MTLCDTGPLVALIDRSDRHHERCVRTLTILPPDPLVTTWPCWVEAIYLVGRIGGYDAQDKLWTYVEKELVRLDRAEPDTWRRLRELMRRYRDVPMDLADASLVELAERSGSREIFTLDSHFYVYRIHGDASFDVVPRR